MLQCWCCCSETTAEKGIDPEEPASVPHRAPHLKDSSQEPASVPHRAPRLKDPSQGFIAVLERQAENENIGLEFDLMDGDVMYVCEVASRTDSPVQRYNSSAPADEQIMVGHYITMVNGVPGNALADDLRKQLVGCQSLELLVRRPNRFECEIRKNGNNLGLELAHSDRGGTLNVLEVVKDGAVARCAADVQAGDRIVGVGDLEGSPKELLRALRLADPVVLKISRPW